MIKQLKSIRFNNTGTVTKEMRFHYASRPCHYMEDVDQWATRYNNSYFNYLYMEHNGESVAPPVGMRSSVPLGGLGASTVELRADGSLRDWTIFNNSPAGGNKVQLEESGFYLWVKEKGRPPMLKALKTHDPSRTSVVSQIEYSGAYPVSRLIFSDDELRIKITLYAFSEFHLYQAEKSTKPAVHFTFILENPREEQVEVSLLFVLPNHIEGTYLQEESTLFLTKDGDQAHSGEMPVNVDGTDLKVTSVAGESLFGMLREYSIYGEFPHWMQMPQKENPVDGAVGKIYYQPKLKRFGSVAGNTRMNPKESRTITFTLGWYFPFRPHAGEVDLCQYSRHKFHRCTALT
jgi:non-lysosomal glucosylceramidase